MEQAKATPWQRGIDVPADQPEPIRGGDSFRRTCAIAISTLEWSYFMTTSKNRSMARKPGVSLLMLRSREIGATEFKARCLELMDEVDRLGIEVIITKHRKPVARLAPARVESARFCGSLAGMVIKEHDLVTPIDTPWAADASHFA